MQHIIYDEAPYHVLYYDEPARRLPDRPVRRVENQPSQNGNPLFGFGPLGYTYLTDANGPGAQPERVGDGVIVTGRIRGGGRIGPGRDRVRGTEHPADDTSSTNSPVLLIVGDRGARGGAGRRFRHASSWQGGRRGGVTDSPAGPALAARSSTWVADTS